MTIALLMSEQTLTTVVVAICGVVTAIISAISAIFVARLSKEQKAVNANVTGLNSTVIGFTDRLDGKLDELIASKEAAARAVGRQERRDEEKVEVSDATTERERVEDRDKK